MQIGILGFWARRGGNIIVNSSVPLEREHQQTRRRA
jgi:hypothetical protein